MFRRAAGCIAAVLVLAACSGLTQKDPDHSAINPTSVLDVRVSGDGIKDFPAFESTTLSFRRPNMQRIESSVAGSGAFARFLGSAGTDTRIERLDRKLAWTLDTKNKQYTECPLKGCGGAVTKKPAPKKPADDDKAGETACRLKIGTTSVTVEPTGQKRNMNGFDAEQYDMKWLVTFRDNASRKATSAVSVDVWIAPVTPALKDAMALEKTFARNRDKSLGIESDFDRTAVLPPEAARMINSYLSANVSPTDRANVLAGAKKLDKVKGQPVLTTVKWRFGGEACSMDETMKDVGDKPLFILTSEVKSHRMEGLHDSLFAPPKEYKRKK